jgi:hypothetical protein
VTNYQLSHKIYSNIQSIDFEIYPSHHTADGDECKKNSPCPSVGGVCHNTVGAYRCSCQAGRRLNKQNNTCDPDTTLITGNTLAEISSCMLPLFVSPCIYIRRKARALI